MPAATRRRALRSILATVSLAAASTKASRSLNSTAYSNGDLQFALRFTF